MSVRSLFKGNPLSKLIGRHDGETIIVIGNSRSLNEMDMGVMDDYTTIGVNRLLRTYTPNYLLVVDKSVIRDEHENMCEFQDDCEMLIFPGVMSSVALSWYPGDWWNTGPMTGNADPVSKTGPIHIGQRGNSAYEATQIAYRMGAKRILLAGVDLHWPTSGDTHSFGNGKSLGCKLRDPDLIIDDFCSLRDQLALKKVELTSISPWNTAFRKRLGYLNPSEI